MGQDLTQPISALDTKDTKTLKSSLDDVLYQPKVTPLVVTSHPSLASLSPTSRGCLLPHESSLDHHAAYSVSRYTRSKW